MNMDIIEFHQKLEQGLDHVFGQKFVAQERYTFGWEDPRTTLAFEITEPEEPKFEIRWWHRVIYFFYKLARRCL